MGAYFMSLIMGNNLYKSFQNRPDDTYVCTGDCFVLYYLYNEITDETSCLLIEMINYVHVGKLLI